MKKYAFSVLLGLCISTLSLAQNLTWEFPIRRPHAGVILGNGTQGLLVWGQDNTLRITVGRAGFWDHRGGNPFAAKATFQDVRRLLEAKDEKGLTALFAVPKKTTPNLERPQQIGGGRLDITLPTGWKLRRAELNCQTGEVSIQAQNPKGKIEILRLRQAIDQEIAWVQLPAALQGKTQQTLVPSWEYVKNQLEKVGIKAPEIWQEGDVQGFTQTLPEDAPLSIAYQAKGAELRVFSQLGQAGRKQLITQALQWQTAPVAARANQYWKDYWAAVPRIQLPDPTLQEIVDYGLYKQACLTPPQGVAAALQSCLNEEYQLPPWSNDYHFNINIQMIYTPALASNRAEHLNPLWNMMNDWMLTLQENGEKFFGRPGALMLPHAVDDRCQVVGTFWTGTIDHACTAWMAYLAWQHYRYTMDKRLLEQTAYPLLVGAFEGYWAMLDEVPDGQGGKRYSLPVSVSPEYGGSSMRAWGRDASFQLAALHRICRVLQQAAPLLGRPTDPRWADVDQRLPAYTTVDDVWMPENQARGKRIALWEGQDLVGSHRHHSHLGGLFPFCTINPQAPEHQAIVSTSLRNWTFKGPGAWSGWCVPWASAIWSRMDNPEAAVQWLHYWHANFTNEGRGTLHNAAFQGTSLIADAVRTKRPANQPNNEIMQLDAGFGALTAVYELLVQNREDVIYVLPSLHRDWQELSFENLGAEGAFRIGAKVSGGRCVEISVKSLAGGKLKLAHGLGDAYLLNGQATNGTLLEKDCQPGEVLLLKRR
jgi:hypothetical protein